MDVPCNQVLDYLKLKGQKFLDEDLQNKLRDILKCAVCLEVPKGKELKVLTCEQGHHFCPNCHRKLKTCGVCRGQFLQGRNFVVEEMITQLGSSLGLTESNLPPPDQPPKFVPGTYMCLHNCSTHLKAGHMLKHIRKNHKQYLLDNVRSFPHLNRFDLIFNVSYSVKNLNTYSVQISDMGLFTIIINITDNCLIGSVHTLADNRDLSSFKCRLTVKIKNSGCFHEFSISDCDLHQYIYETIAVLSSGRCLRIETTKLSELMNIGDAFQVIFSISKKKEENEEKNHSDMTVFFPEVPAFVLSDRKTRRNRQRNVRKRKLKLRLNEGKQLERDILRQVENLNLSPSSNCSMEL